MRRRWRIAAAWIAAPSVCLTLALAVPAVGVGLPEELTDPAALEKSSLSSTAEPGSQEDVQWEVDEPTQAPAPAPAEEAPPAQEAPETEAPESEAPESEVPAPDAPSAPAGEEESDGAQVPQESSRTSGGDDLVSPFGLDPLEPPAPLVAGGTVVVRTGDIRDPSSVVQDLPNGITLELVNNGGAAYSQFCTTSGGTCRFVGVPAGRSYIVKDSAAIAGYRANTSLRTGNYEGDGGYGNAGLAYQFVTPTIAEGATYTTGSQFMLDNLTGTGSNSNNNVYSSSGRWQLSRTNQSFPAACGLDVGIVVDRSASISSSELSQLKTAVAAFGTALAGTPSQVTGYSFSTDALGASSEFNLAGGSSAAVTNWVNGLSTTSGATNWDRGLWQAQGQGHKVVILLTDGNPNRHSNPARPTSDYNNRFRDVEEAIFTANTLKSQGTRVIVIGVGEGMTGSGASRLNLAALSGPTAFTGSNAASADFFLAANYIDAGNALKALASANCAGTLTVAKEVELTNGTKVLTPGWGFGATTTGGVGVSPSSSTTGPSGALNFALSYPAGVSTTNVTVTEELRAGYPMTGVRCNTGPNNAYVPVANGNVTLNTGKFTIAVPRIAQVSCIVTNKEPDPGIDITVNKVWTINGGAEIANGSQQQPAWLAATLKVNNNATAWGALTHLTKGATVALSETATITGMPLCSLGTPYVKGSPNVNMTVAGGSTNSNKTATTTFTNVQATTTYTIVNPVTCTSQIVLLKRVVNDNGGTATASNWTLKAEWSSTSATRPGAESGSAAIGVPANTNLTLTEEGPTGYQQVRIEKLVNGTFQPVTGNVFQVAPAQTDTYRFVNDDIAPKLTLVKVLAQGHDGSALPPAWKLTANGVVFTQQVATDVTAGTAYTLAELDGPAGWSLQSLVCDGYPNTTKQAPSITLPVGANVTCTFTNQQIPASLEITKTANSVTQGSDGVWTITYTVAVKNLTARLTPYTLTDTPTFGPGGVVKSLSYSGQASGTVNEPVGTVTLSAAGASIAGGATHAYQVTVKATWITPPNGTYACGQDAGGFLNKATVTYSGGTKSAAACLAPAAPTVTKTALDPDQNPDGSWTVSYDVTASYVGGNGQPGQVAYALSDTPAALPAGVTGSWSAGAPAATSGATAVGASPVWNGSGTLATGVLPAGSSVTIRITGVLVIAPNVTSATLTCPNLGIVNRASVTNGVAVTNTSACVTVDPPGVTVDKKVSTTTPPVQADDGTWTVTYDVVVSKSSDLTAIYDLSDTLDFGTGISVISASWTGATSGNFAGSPWSEQLANDKALVGAAGTSHTYTVTVKASVAPQAYTDGEATCTPNDTGGFLNRVSVTADGTTTNDKDCATPSLPTIEKDFVSATQAETGVWSIVYTLTVEGGAYASSYDLLDVPDPATGVTVTGASASRNSVDTGWDGKPANPIVSNVPIVANATHVYTVTVTASVGSVATGDRVCVPGTAKEGYYNKAILAQEGVAIDDDDACGPIKETVTPDVQKSARSVTQGSDGSWTIVYDVTVTQPAEGLSNPEGVGSVYSLRDDLDFPAGVSVIGATWSDGDTTSNFVGLGAQLASSRTIAVGATHSYVVTVKADITLEGFDSNLMCGEGQGGFLNRATLTSFGVTKDATGCAEPLLPEIEKVSAGVVQNDDGTYLLSYDVIVTAPQEDGLQPTAYIRVTDDPEELPNGLVGVTDEPWRAVAGSDTPPATNATQPTSGDWVIALGDIDPGEVWTYRITRLVTVAFESIDPETFGTCDETESTGLLVVNSTTLEAGLLNVSDEACNTVPFTDVGIIKTATLPVAEEGAEPLDSVEAGDEFTYVLTVTNYSTHEVSDVVVTDAVPSDRLEVLEVEVPDGWTDNSEGNLVSVTAPVMPSGESSYQIYVKVKVLPAPQAPIVVVAAGDPAPLAPIALAELENEACVALEGDTDDANDCDGVEVPLREINALVYQRCVADAPYLGYAVSTTPSLAGKPITMTWLPATAAVPAGVTRTLTSGDAGEIPWPGATFLASGVPVDWPGSRAMEPGDLNPDGTVKTGLIQFSGLIFDEATPDFPWRGETTVTFSVNPEVTFTSTYPPATPDCAIERAPDIEITKTASTDLTAPGSRLSFDLAVKNNGIGAALPLTVTDAIPATMAVERIVTDTAAFPGWRNCAVTGKDSRGYGGTLNCELYGALIHGQSAPALTLDVLVDPQTKVTRITNTATVNWTNADVPSQTGSDSDSDSVRLKWLALTGVAWIDNSLIAALGFILLGGAGLVFKRRRRTILGA